MLTRHKNFTTKFHTITTYTAFKQLGIKLFCKLTYEKNKGEVFLSEFLHSHEFLDTSRATSKHETSPL